MGETTNDETRGTDTREHPFAATVRILGRGPGRSRSLTREEARDALGTVLRNEADPHQVGAFLMLLRYRGEDPDEITGLIEAARDDFAPRLPAAGLHADLDWPSYGAGRTRGAPWFLLAALALAGAGHRVLMHGSNEFTGGTEVAHALPLLGHRPAESLDDAARLLDRHRFAYVPLGVLSPGLDRLLRLRALLGLRSPINTVARLIDPGNARAGVDGVFHPPYIAVHLGAAMRLGRPRLVVVKGGGGEAERTPAKPVAAHLHRVDTAPEELLLPALGSGKPGRDDDLVRVWQERGVANAEPGALTAQATVALGLLALGKAGTAEEADATAAELWRATHRCPAAVPHP